VRSVSSEVCIVYALVGAALEVCMVYVEVCILYLEESILFLELLLFLELPPSPLAPFFGFCLHECIYIYVCVCIYMYVYIQESINYTPIRVSKFVTLI